MSIEVAVQYAIDWPNLPNESQLRLWVKTALRGLKENAKLTIRIVGEDEGTQLNEQWRKSKGSTNVLSFTYEEKPEIMPNLLGDIVVCAPVITKEAKEQYKSIDAHWAHMIVHGVLHLNGFDHLNPKDADYMENLEIKILKELNYNNPYLITSS